jgi:hypothetical protein
VSATTPTGRAELAADPVAAIVEAVARLEPGLDHQVVRATVCQVASSRTKRRRLAEAIAADPHVLTDGRSSAPVAVGQLVRALLALGASGLVAPCCADCGKPSPLRSRRGAERICDPCAARARDQTTTCSACGRQRRATHRDRHGQPRCRNCPPEPEPDPQQAISAIVARLEPTLPASQVTVAIQQAAATPAACRRLAWALEAEPGLLTGAGASGPPAVLRLIAELGRAGATRVIAPVCPRCGRVVHLAQVDGGQRVCAACYQRLRATPCAGCGAVRPPATRDGDGRPRCSRCQQADPANLEPCAGCGRRRPVSRRTTHGPLCRACWRAPVAVCSGCGRPRPCDRVRSGAPRCERCARRVEACARCGRTAPVVARRPDGPRCASCCATDPQARRRCQACGALERRYAQGRCARCVLDQRLRALLGDADGVVPAELELVHRTLAATDPPRAGLKWLARSSAAAVLAELGAGTRLLSHQALDELLPDKAVDHLRHILVAAGCLPARDERLARLERWIAQTLATITDPDDQRLLRAFARWHLLGRLRRRVGDGHASGEQIARVRASLRAAVGFLAWLRSGGRTLAACRQADIDRWLASGSRTRYNARDFVCWAVTRRLTVDLELPPRPKARPTRPIDADQRWTVARRLLTDTDLDPADRVAGLLVLCYAQPATAIARLTLDRITHDPGGVHLLLGSSPALLPSPLADLVLELAATRTGHATVGSPPTSPWLFPGGTPGRPIGADRLTIRLGRLGIPTRPGRAAALLDLAAQLPVGVLARLLGISPGAANSWRTSAGGTWSGYAADLTRRGQPSPAGHPAR